METNEGKITINENDILLLSRAVQDRLVNIAKGVKSRNGSYKDFENLASSKRYLGMLVTFANTLSEQRILLDCLKDLNKIFKN